MDNIFTENIQLESSNDCNKTTTTNISNAMTNNLSNGDSTRIENEVC